MRTILILVLFWAPIATAQDSRTMRYREVDGATQILYEATCRHRKGLPSVCSLRAVSVSTDKSPGACMIVYQSLFEFENAQNPQKDTFSVTVSGGLCEYSNTYVMSPTGLTQTKTSPAVVPENMKPFCRSFPPKVYQAGVFAEDAAFGFLGIPIGNCKVVSVKF